MGDDLPALGDVAPTHIICGTCGVVTLAIFVCLAGCVSGGL